MPETSETPNEKRWLQITESVAKSLSYVLVPLTIAYFGRQVQMNSIERTTSEEFVKTAISIINLPTNTGNEQKPLTSDQKAVRLWGVQLLDKYSPVPLSKEMFSALVTGELVLPERGYYPPLKGYCTANPMLAAVGTPITFTAHPIGGDNYYSYVWTGSEGVHGNRSVVTVKFTTPGEKEMMFTCYSNGQSVTGECQVLITQGDNP